MTQNTGDEWAGVREANEVLADAIDEATPARAVHSHVACAAAIVSIDRLVVRMGVVASAASLTDEEHALSDDPGCAALAQNVRLMRQCIGKAYTATDAGTLKTLRSLDRAIEASADLWTMLQNTDGGGADHG